MAFQMHFRRTLYNGEADAEKLEAIAEALLEKYGRGSFPWSRSQAAVFAIPSSRVMTG